MSSTKVAFYGDDFTGSADVMEVLQWHGVPSVLYLEPPTPAQLEAFAGKAAIGVAGSGRTMTPDQMRERLPAVFRALAGAGARFVHYKTCSTFDSSPEIGSIGVALEVGRETVGGAVTPIVVGAPNLGRYQVFGNLFARSGLDSVPHRLDRHPTMSRHPITPMAEADLRVHLSRQTGLPIALCDVLDLSQPGFTPDYTAMAERGERACLLDVLTDDHLAAVGRAIEAAAADSEQIFVLGSSGVEYALCRHWEQTGAIPGLTGPVEPDFGPVDQVLVVSGSCSPVGARQLEHAAQNGYTLVAIDTPRLVDPETQKAEVEASIQRALKPLRSGESVVLHASRGPDDPRVGQTIDGLKRLGMSDLDIRLGSGERIGPALGRMMAALLREHPLPRVGVAGGDTSGHVAHALGIWALEAVSPLAPGSPLCRCYADGHQQPFEAFFKGGQVGRDNVWPLFRDGSAAAAAP
ncbi:four-carbon acid sugar kinase family protein [Botrimarina sp.]|uniref:four-carbon acid sugar kinase family protein n=1 Tax=Botrimarina sp. TaxID=2795802 RepID=UPI0032EFA5A1